MSKATLLVSILAVVMFVAGNARGDGEAPLAKAVKDFNEKAKDNVVGKKQPELTVDEVVAAIRGWIRDRYPSSDDVYASYQKIAATGILPKGAKITFITGWQGFNDFDFDVWWVDLEVPVDRGGFVFRIRDQKISSRPAQK